jgi:hypothetical protein
MMISLEMMQYNVNAALRDFKNKEWVELQY